MNVGLAGSTPVRVNSAYGRDKLKDQKGRGIIILKEEMERIRLFDQQLHISHVIEVPNISFHQNYRGWYGKPMWTNIGTCISNFLYLKCIFKYLKLKMKLLYQKTNFKYENMNLNIRKYKRFSHILEFILQYLKII